jgi:hypothetical protein
MPSPPLNIPETQIASGPTLRDVFVLAQEAQQLAALHLELAVIAYEFAGVLQDLQAHGVLLPAWVGTRLAQVQAQALLAPPSGTPPCTT